ncbi:hypothetical protein [Allorhodopirellula heiligendammensis]|uniref:Secreted protein n=1 Tax=Allorhodopirellula heiligendammensis TaxID=2714739 RepID=A0A5C6C253_9BACT|nr:hypothetical protein [Allorhodopirellula heiligendammensis]TWU18165.1 hypothetical protein Poly21_03200 [Allorhodopirellula heiligendammensis]
MIARFLQRLTLIAFTVHAVLGCCWHHSHAVAEQGCHHLHQRAGLDESVGCCADGSGECHDSAARHTATASHECHDDQGHSGETSQAAMPPSIVVCSVASGPCEHSSHQCDEASCSYVPRDISSHDGFLSIPVRHLMPEDGMLCLSTGNGIRLDGAETAFAPPLVSSQQRCAILQSWQI